MQNAFSPEMESLPQIDYFYGGLSVIDFEFMVTIVVLIEILFLSRSSLSNVKSRSSKKWNFQ